MAKLCILISAFVMICAQTASAAWPGDWYVATNGTGQGTNGWADATNNLQGAINECAIGKTVLVSNGVYQTGGTVVGSMTNRVYISKAITVRSIDNNPATTVIKGAWDPAINGPAAIRCAYMVAGATLSGFTLTNGATIAGGYGGGVYGSANSATISNCVIIGCSAGYYGGGICGFDSSTSIYAYNCSILSNRVSGARSWGGGAMWATLNNCTVNFNRTAGAATTGRGGGAYDCTMINCQVVSNYTDYWGGGANGCTMTNCTLAYNNNIGGFGGGAFGCTLYDCLVYGNQASDGGGVYAIWGASLINCTVVGNYANGNVGGGIANGGAAAINVINSIVYSNTALNNYPNWVSYGGGTISFYNSSTFPTNQTGYAGSSNTTNNPLFVAFGNGYGLTHVPGDYHLQPNSPCLNSGLNQAWMNTAADRDSRARIDRFSGRVDMGCYEYLPKGMMFKVR